jgi:hypothetical protein
MRSSSEWGQDILDCLEGTSYDEPMPVKDISEIVGINDGESCPRTRKLILEAMKEYNVPIGSDNRGYYIINTAHEMQRYLNSLLRRQLGITQRIEIDYNACHGRN